MWQISHATFIARLWGKSVIFFCLRLKMRIYRCDSLKVGSKTEARIHIILGFSLNARHTKCLECCSEKKTKQIQNSVSYTQSWAFKTIIKIFLRHVFSWNKYANLVVNEIAINHFLFTKYYAKFFMKPNLGILKVAEKFCELIV